MEQLLSEDELQRARRFRNAEHSRRFVVAHGRLRQQLALLLAAAPASLGFFPGRHGKPRLAGELSETGLEFNLSHSGAWALVGWAWHRAVGVDIECWRPLNDGAALVRRYFSPVEAAAYASLPQTLRQRAFFAGWTRKEAYVKAVGRGLGLPLDSFSVSLGDEGQAQLLLQASALPDDDRRWCIAAPGLAAGVSAAVAVEGDAILILPAA